MANKRKYRFMVVLYILVVSIMPVYNALCQGVSRSNIGLSADFGIVNFPALRTVKGSSSLLRGNNWNWWMEVLFRWKIKSGDTGIVNSFHYWNVAIGWRRVSWRGDASQYVGYEHGFDGFHIGVGTSQYFPWWINRGRTVKNFGEITFGSFYSLKEWVIPDTSVQEIARYVGVPWVYITVKIGVELEGRRGFVHRFGLSSTFLFSLTEGRTGIRNSPYPESVSDINFFWNIGMGRLWRKSRK